MPIPRWKTFLIQLLNVAGLGPVFGVLLGSAFGPVAFLWITLGGILMGSMHDFIAGVMSLKRNGESHPEVVGHYLGNTLRQLIRLLSIIIMILVGAAFMSQPAVLIASHVELPVEGFAFEGMPWELLIILGVILIYYIFATILPIDKIIGRVYPIFGLALLVMALGLLFVLLTRSDIYHIPELTSLRNYIDNPAQFPIMPMLFTTIACGAISGFHATQSPMMARCIRSESEARPVFFGAMITESIIALIWAAIAMAFWGGVEGLNGAIASSGGSAALMADEIIRTTLGSKLSVVVIIGIVGCAITSGDTAFRSARLILADVFGLEQRSLLLRLLVSLPLFVLALLLITKLPFNSLWAYIAWLNQLLSAITLWAIVAYLSERRKPTIIALPPAIFMSYVCMSFIFISPLMFHMSNHLLAYILAAICTIAISIYMTYQNRRNNARRYS